MSLAQANTGWGFRLVFDFIPQAHVPYFHKLDNAKEQLLLNLELLLKSDLIMVFRLVLT